MDPALQSPFRPRMPKALTMMVMRAGRRRRARRGRLRLPLGSPDGHEEAPAQQGDGRRVGDGRN